MIQIKYKDSDDNLFPLSDAPNVKSHDAAHIIFEVTPKHKAYMDLTGHFPYTFSCGSQ